MSFSLNVVREFERWWYLKSQVLILHNQRDQVFDLCRNDYLALEDSHCQHNCISHSTQETRKDLVSDIWKNFTLKRNLMLLMFSLNLYEQVQAKIIFHIITASLLDFLDDRNKLNNTRCCQSIKDYVGNIVLFSYGIKNQMLNKYINHKKEKDSRGSWCKKSK